MANIKETNKDIIKLVVQFAVQLAGMLLGFNLFG